MSQATSCQLTCCVHAVRQLSVNHPLTTCTPTSLEPSLTLWWTMWMKLRGSPRETARQPWDGRPSYRSPMYPL